MTDTPFPFSDSDLSRLAKPAQYLGGELHAIVKDDAAVDVHFALCFPDTYEVGMSHLGLQILYDLINRDEHAWAERAFMPLSDMEQLLRERNLRLPALESHRPLSSFDLVGFSLQYELCATNVLSMLDLGGIPIRSADRTAEHPVVIAGGPYAQHPEALAPFIDAFFLGDAENAIPEIIAAVRHARTEAGTRDRAKLLAALDAIEGVYVPAFFEPQYLADGQYAGTFRLDGRESNVRRRILPTLAGQNTPQAPVVPNIRTIHNRLPVEIMRGCVRGCRFCQAGYLYRPQRERPPSELFSLIESSLRNTGVEELSLLSLSSADYCSVVPLLRYVMDRYGEDETLAVAFPSTRVDALTTEVLEQVQRVRRTNFTIAPEAGTQRLRDVINKGVTDEQILETCSRVFSMGWNGIKLYFMIGFPTETDADLDAIVDLCARIKRLPEAKGKNITASVSTLVPKPHTPFQWVAQISPSETLRKQRLLADGLHRVKVTFRYHDAFSSFLEGIFARSGRELAPVIERAYALGCRLDSWDSELDRDKWTQAFLDCGVDAESYLNDRDPGSPLPWDHLHPGISREYLRDEYERALRAETTGSCRASRCTTCGTCDFRVVKNVLYPREQTEELVASLPASNHETAGIEPEARVRLCFEKSGALRFIGHLELVTLFHRAVRRARLPIAFSQGFHPLPRIAFGPPLQLGIESRAEYADLYFTRALELDLLCRELNQALPDDLRVREAKILPMSAPSIQESIARFRYSASWIAEPRGICGRLLKTVGQSPEEIREQLLDVTVIRHADEDGNRSRKKNSADAFPLREYLSDIALLPPSEKDPFGALEFTQLCDPRRARPKPTEILFTLSACGIGEYRMEKTGTSFHSAALS